MAKTELHFSFILTADGLNPGLWHTDTTPRDVNRYAISAGIDTDYRTGDEAIESSEYADVFTLHQGDEFAHVTASGILPAREFFQMLDGIGCIFEDVETMGTIGGPLGHWAPDVAYYHESQLMVFSMRATPVLKKPDGVYKPLSDNSWERMRTILRHCDHWDLWHGNIRRGLDYARQRGRL